MKISVFGNQDLGFDSLPIKILPELKKMFPDVVFSIEDPNELDFPKAGEWIIIDTVVGLKEIKLLTFADLKKTTENRISAHDFDLTAYLFWLNKLNKNTDIKIIGIPPTISENEALNSIMTAITNLLPENERRN